MLGRLIQLMVLGLLMMRPRPIPPPVVPPTPGGDDAPPKGGPPGPPPGVDDPWPPKEVGTDGPRGRRPLPPTPPPGVDTWPPKIKQPITPIDGEKVGLERESILDRIRRAIDNFDPKWVLMAGTREGARSVEQSGDDTA